MSRSMSSTGGGTASGPSAGGGLSRRSSTGGGTASGPSAGSGTASGPSVEGGTFGGPYTGAASSSQRASTGGGTSRGSCTGGGASQALRARPKSLPRGVGKREQVPGVGWNRSLRRRRQARRSSMSWSFRREERYHVRRDCYGLRRATRTHDLMPCPRCCTPDFRRLLTSLPGPIYIRSPGYYHSLMTCAGGEPERLTLCGYCMGSRRQGA